MSTSYTFSAATNIGGRESNQDNFFAGGIIPFPSDEVNFSSQGIGESSAPGIFVVCDGVGSRESSAKTARATIDSLVNRFKDNTVYDYSEEWLRETICAVQKDIADFLNETGENGSNTLSFLIISQEYFVFANIGDSPAFLVKNSFDSLIELSVRHNLETYNRLTGKPVGPDDSRYLLYSFGSNPFDLSSVVNIADGVVESGDSFILCSDGITNAISEEKITEMLRDGAQADDFVNLAILTPGSDNCTAIVIHID
ncbi:MAG: serine/threonine-protein phosphatase [Clostridia bacterium]|nr:serine/threonine-protein phosphatase [Clostridia bacterium]